MKPGGSGGAVAASVGGRGGPGTAEGTPLLATDPRPVRVLLIGNFFGLQGGGQYCKDLAVQLALRGHRVLSVSHSRPRALRLFAMTFYPWWQRRRFDVAQVDVFSGPSFLWAEAATMALRTARKPFALTLHGGGLPAFAQRYPRRMRKLLCRAAEVTAPSSYLAEAFKPFRPDVRVIPNAVELSQYPFRQRHVARPIFIWLRAFHRMYDPEMAVHVLGQLVGKYPQTQLTMVGADKDGSLARCRALAAQLKLEGHVKFVPAVPRQEVPQLLSSADIFLNTTTVDNTPVSVIEAMACGLCVVSTDAGGMPHLVRDGQEALLVPVGDAAAMVEAIARLLRDPEVAARLSTNARAKAASFDWSAVLPQWEALFERLAGHRCGWNGGAAQIGHHHRFGASAR